MDKSTFYVERINKVVDYIETNLPNKIDLESLAQVACLSKFHFHRIFYAFTKESLYNFINRLRLERAAALLLNQKHTITYIAFNCGFNDSATFSRAFKKHFKLTAINWRRKNSKIHQAFKPSKKYTYNKNEKDNIRMISVEVKILPETRIAYTRHTGVYAGNSKLFNTLYKRVLNWGRSLKLINYPATKNIIVYHDPMEISPRAKLRISVGITIKDDVPTQGAIGKMSIAKGRYIFCKFKLKADEYRQAWNKIYREVIPQRGLQPREGQCLEFYSHNCYDKQSKKTTVEMVVPIEKI